MRTHSSKSGALKISGPQRFFAVSTALLTMVLLQTNMRSSADNVYPPPPNNLIDDSVKKTVKAAARDGWVPCPGECLKLSQKGWVHKKAPGHPDSDVWMVFPFNTPRGPSWQAYTQQHCGHIIRVFPDRNAIDTGICPVCNGTGWIRKDAPRFTN